MATEPKSRWRWPVWLLFVLAWSAALLVPNPVVLWLGHSNGAGKPHPQLQLALHLFSKSVHVCAYALAAGLTAWLRVAGRWRWALLAFWSVHAFATEFLQQFVPTRGASLYDVCLDHIGLLIGVALTWRWWRD